jgi:hypothetical protein
VFQSTFLILRARSISIAAGVVIAAAIAEIVISRSRNALYGWPSARSARNMLSIKKGWA